MLRRFSAVSRRLGVSRFVILCVALTLLLTPDGSHAAIVIDPLSFKIRESDSFGHGALIAQASSHSANHDGFQARRGRDSHHIGTGATDGLRSASIHGGRPPHFLSNSRATSASGVSQVAGRGHQAIASRGHDLQRLPGTPALPGVSGLPGTATLPGTTVVHDHVPLTPIYGSLPTDTTFGRPHVDLYPPESLPNRLVSLGEQTNLNNVAPAPAALDALPAPEPATAIIWAIGLAATACVTARRRGGLRIARG